LAWGSFPETVKVCDVLHLISASEVACIGDELFVTFCRGNVSRKVHQRRQNGANFCEDCGSWPRSLRGTWRRAVRQIFPSHDESTSGGYGNLYRLCYAESLLS